MSEYWKSNAKKYCDYCKVWIQDNKASISIHESGYKHKQNVKVKLDEIKKNADKKRHEEKKMSESMAAIERAAMESMKNDLASNPSLRKQYGSVATSSSSIEIPKKVQESTHTKPAEKKPVDKKQTDQKSAAKRKSDGLPEAKIGKWQVAEEKKPEPVQKPGFIDLQLPTVTKGPINKSLYNCFSINPKLENKSDQQEKPQVKEEVKNKWVAVGFTALEEHADENVNKTTDDDKNFEQKNITKATETELIHSENDMNLNKDIDQKIVNEISIKSEKIEVSDVKNKKDKVITFKKRKVDSSQLRNRTEDD